MIELKDVSFRYKEAEDNVLSRLNLKIRDGEVLLLCGESGCGKTSVIRLINGLVPHYYPGELKGEVRVNGILTSESEIYTMGCMVSSVFQNPRSQFFCVDTVSELAFAAENRRMDPDRIRQRIREISEKMNLEKLLSRTMFQLSGGEKQRIACASVSVTENPVIVLDEPSSNLDASSVEDLRSILEIWKKEGKTIVIAEHRLSYLRGIADRVLHMKRGEGAEEFSGEEFFSLSEGALEERGLRRLDMESLRPENKEKPQGEMEIHSLSCRYKGRKEPAFSTKGLRLPTNAVCAIIGRNGAGKSTFVRALMGLDKRAKGEIVEKGRRVKARERLLSSFLVMQDVNRQLFTESVLEEVLLGMKDKDEAQARRLLREFHLEEFAERHPMSLSGGQKQRLAVVSAIASGRNKIFFDEPTSGLDLLHMRKVASSVRELQKQGKDIFLITHDTELIHACCNYVIHVEDGGVRSVYPLTEETDKELKSFFSESGKEKNL